MLLLVNLLIYLTFSSLQFNNYYEYSEHPVKYGRAE